MLVRGRKHPCSIDKYWRLDPIESPFSPFTEWKTGICSTENCLRMLRMTPMPGWLDLNSGFPFEYSDNSKGFVSPKSENAKQLTMKHKENFKVIFFKKNEVWTINWSILFSLFYWQKPPSGCLNETLTSISLQVLYTGFIFLQELWLNELSPLFLFLSKVFFPLKYPQKMLQISNEIIHWSPLQSQSTLFL